MQPCNVALLRILVMGVAKRWDTCKVAPDALGLCLVQACREGSNSLVRVLLEVPRGKRAGAVFDGLRRLKMSPLLAALDAESMWCTELMYDAGWNGPADVGALFPRLSRLVVFAARACRLFLLGKSFPDCRGPWWSRPMSTTTW